MADSVTVVEMENDPILITDKAAETQQLEAVAVAHEGDVKLVGLSASDDLEKKYAAVAEPVYNLALLKKLIVNSFKSEIKTGLILQSIAILIVVLYYSVSRVEIWLDQIGEWKDTYGLLYSAVVTSIFGGCIPYSIILMRHEKRSIKLKQYDMIFFMTYWAYRGMEIDLFYRFQGYIFGNNNEPWTVAKKVMLDQFVYNPIWGVPIIFVPWFLWRDLDFDYKATWKKLHYKGFLLFRTVKLLVTVWMIWIPCVSAIYSLPATLQLPLFNVVLIFSQLIVTSKADVVQANEE